MPDHRYSIAYQEALRAISDQQKALDVLQSRASAVASAGAVVTGLIGFGAGDQGPRIFGVLAIICLLAIVCLIGVIIWPRKEWRFNFLASSLQWNYIEGPNPLREDLMKRDLALHLEGYFKANARHLDTFGVLLSAAIVLLLIDVSAVLFEIWR